MRCQETQEETGKRICFAGSPKHSGRVEDEQQIDAGDCLPSRSYDF